jgi:hypothetical protein
MQKPVQTIRAITMQQENRLIKFAIIFLLLGCSIGFAGSKISSKPITTTTVLL